jgi:hypothetical protein
VGVAWLRQPAHRAADLVAWGASLPGLDHSAWAAGAAARPVPSLKADPAVVPVHPAVPAHSVAVWPPPAHLMGLPEVRRPSHPGLAAQAAAR